METILRVVLDILIRLIASRSASSRRAVDASSDPQLMDRIRKRLREWKNSVGG